MKRVAFLLIGSQGYDGDPGGPVAPAPVGRSTPHFHDILLENVEVGNGVVAGVIVGLPEAPVLGFTLRNIDLQATTGMQVGYANVELAQMQVKVAEGKGIVLEPGATVTGSSAELPRRQEDAQPKGLSDG